MATIHQHQKQMDEHTLCLKKVAQQAISITLPIFDGFSFLFTDTFCRQFTTKLSSEFPPHPKRVATLSCETQML